MQQIVALLLKGLLEENEALAKGILILRVLEVLGAGVGHNPLRHQQQKTETGTER
jgi:hypothetical protein